MRKDSTKDRPLVAEPVQVWMYQENYDELMKLCEENECEPGDVLRDAFNQWLIECRIGKHWFTKSATEGSMTAKSAEYPDKILMRIRESIR